MNVDLVNQISREVLQYYGIDYLSIDFNYADAEKSAQIDPAKLTKELIEKRFTETFSRFNCIAHSVPANFSNVKSLIDDFSRVVIITLKREGRWVHYVLKPTLRKEEDAVWCYSTERGKYKKSLEEVSDILSNEAEAIESVLVVFPLESIVAEDELIDDSKKGKVLTPWNRLMKLLSLDKRQIIYIYIYATAIGVIGLSLPLGIQAIMSIIQTGTILPQFWILVGMVIFGLSVNAFLQIMQMVIVESMQRRVFTRAAFEFAFRIPRFRMESLLNSHAPELINRFFDVITIQKGLPKLLIEMSTALLQIFFGLVLLAFYHPLFLFFAFILILILAFLIYLTGPIGLKASINESKAKYKVVYWLEEMARTLMSFKLAPFSTLPVSRVDYHVNTYLKYRAKHFNVLIGQFSYIMIFQILIIGGVLIIGGFLVVDRSITLGQFVASEIVIILIVTSTEKLVTKFEVIYDMLTAVDKLGNVTDIPLDKEKGLEIDMTESKGISVLARNLNYTYSNTKLHALKNLNFEIKPGEKVILAGYANGGKSTLIKILAGFFTDYKGGLTYNGSSLRDIRQSCIRELVSKNISLQEIFDGTIKENITVGRKYVDTQEIARALKTVNLQDWVSDLEEGLNTHIASEGKNFSNSLVYRLILARCLYQRPGMLILNDFFNNFSLDERKKLFKYLLGEPFTMVAVTNDVNLFPYADRILILKDGQLAFEGSYDKLKENAIINEFTPITL